MRNIRVCPECGDENVYTWRFHDHAVIMTHWELECPSCGWTGTMSLEEAERMNLVSGYPFKDDKQIEYSLPPDMLFYLLNLRKRLERT